MNDIVYDNLVAEQRLKSIHPNSKKINEVLNHRLTIRYYLQINISK